MEQYIRQKNIIFLGNSFTYVEYVSDKNRIPDQVNALSGIQTVNLGMVSNTLYEYEAALRSIVKPILKVSKENSWL